MNKRIRTEYPPAFKEQAVLRAKAGDMSVRGLAWPVPRIFGAHRCRGLNTPATQTKSTAADVATRAANTETPRSSS